MVSENGELGGTRTSVTIPRVRIGPEPTSASRTARALGCRAISVFTLSRPTVRAIRNPITEAPTNPLNAASVPITGPNAQPPTNAWA